MTIREPRAAGSTANDHVPITVPIVGPGAELICVDNALRTIVNRKLSVALDPSATLELGGEHLLLEKAGREQQLDPDLGTKRLPVNSQVREGRMLAESDPMFWSGPGLTIRRTVRIMQSDLSSVHASMRFGVENAVETSSQGNLEWRLLLPRCQAFGYAPTNVGPTLLEQGDISREILQQGPLVFSLDSRRLDSPQNRLINLRFSGTLPARLQLDTDEDAHQVVTAFFSMPDLMGSVDRPEVVVDLDYRLLLRQEVSNTVFLVARPEGKNGWQGAVAAGMSWVSRLETCRETDFSGPGFRRFAPLLWFDRQKPLPDQVLRFLHGMVSLQRIIVLGEVLPHDLENLLTALLDKGTSAGLRLQIFTTDEYYRDGVNVLRGNIQARMIIADEPPARVRQMEQIIAADVVPHLDLAPLYLRRFMEEASTEEFLARQVADRSVFLVSADIETASFLATACVPMARHLAAPVLLWSPASQRQIMGHLKQQLQAGRLRRLFLIGRFAKADEDAIELGLAGDQGSTAPPLLFVPVPFVEPIKAAIALAELFKAQLLLDWLVLALRAEHDQLAGLSDITVKQLAREYLEQIKGKLWSRRLVPALQALVDDKDPGDFGPVYHDIFVTSDEFIASFKGFFTAQANTHQELLSVLAPVWNDMLVLSDFDPADPSNLNLYTAACLAAFHEAPLILFPAVTKEKEAFLKPVVKEFEFNIQTTRDLAAAPVEIPAPARNTDLARLVFPPDVRGVVALLNPMTIALYSTSTDVPYEVLPDNDGPVFLKYAIGRLCGADAYDTSLFTASGMLFAHELQCKEQLNVLLCLVDIPQLPRLNFTAEQRAIEYALGKKSASDYLPRQAGSETNEQPIDGNRFNLDVLSDPVEIGKQEVLARLSGQAHLFHFVGHGYDNEFQPQRSGIVLRSTDDSSDVPYDPLTALEIKYRAKLGAHPLVFLNSCFGSSNGRITLAAEENTANPDEASDHVKEKPVTSTAATGRQIMGVSSSFIHIGAAAVMAPLWRIMDDTAIMYAGYWYRYIAQGCSIGEAALLAKVDSLVEMQKRTNAVGGPSVDYTVFSYVIYGDPTQRLYPTPYLLQHYPQTALRLLRLKLPVEQSEAR